jgi:hypothetical protein
MIHLYVYSEKGWKCKDIEYQFIVTSYNRLHLYCSLRWVIYRGNQLHAICFVKLETMVSPKDTVVLNWRSCTESHETIHNCCNTNLSWMVPTMLLWRYVLYSEILIFLRIMGNGHVPYTLKPLFYPNRCSPIGVLFC